MIDTLITLAILAVLGGVMYGLCWLREFFFGSQDCLPPVDHDHKPLGHVRLGIDAVPPHRYGRRRG